MGGTQPCSDPHTGFILLHFPRTYVSVLQMTHRGLCGFHEVKRKYFRSKLY